MLFEMFKHIHFTPNYVKECSKSLIFKPLDLSECNCPETGAFDRLNNPRRNNLENAIVKHLADTRKDKSKPIKLISMGSGGLMSDFIILEKLFVEGFTKIEIDCVDPEIDLEKIENIKSFFKEYNKVSLKISGHKNIDELSPKKPEHTAINAPPL